MDMNEKFMELIRKNYSERELEVIGGKETDENVEFAITKAKEELDLYKHAFRDFQRKIARTSLLGEAKWVIFQMVDMLMTLSDIVEFKDAKELLESDKEMYLNIQKYRAKLFASMLKKYKNE